MSIMEYRTTHWMRHAHPEAKKTTTAEFFQKNKPIKYIQLFPNDLVVMVIGDGNSSELLRFQPAMLVFYKHLWDMSDKADQKLLRKHLKRCVHIREQYKNGFGLESARIWYMSVILGGADDQDNK